MMSLNLLHNSYNMEIKVHLVTKSKNKNSSPTTFEPKLIYSMREYNQGKPEQYTTVALISGREIDVWESMQQIRQLEKEMV